MHLTTSTSVHSSNLWYHLNIFGSTKSLTMFSLIEITVIVVDEDVMQLYIYE